MHAGFRGTHLPVASSRREKDDSAAEMPEPYEDADMDVPNTQALLDAFMSNMSKLADAEYHGLSVLLDSLPDPSSFPPAKTMTAAMAKERGLIPEADEETLRAFSPSEMKLYKHATEHQWTVDELVSTIKLIKSADFKVEDVNVDLHKRVASAIAHGHFASHNMRESDLDGDQDLRFWLRSLEDVLKELLGDARMDGHQEFRFEISRTDEGLRRFGASTGAVSFQLAQIGCGTDCVPVSLVIYIDGSFIKHGIPVKPIYGQYIHVLCHPYVMYIQCICHVHTIHFSKICLIYMLLIISSLTVASRNNDRTVSGKAFAWRLLGMMPALSKTATVGQTTEWRAERRTRLYHSCIDILAQQINDLTGRDVYIRYADKLVRRSRVFLDFLSMDGDEVSTATMCPTTQCTTCWCPKDQLQATDKVFSFRDTQEICSELKTERARLLNPDGTARDRCKDKVSIYIL